MKFEKNHFINLYGNETGIKISNVYKSIFIDNIFGESINKEREDNIEYLKPYIDLFKSYGDEYAKLVDMMQCYQEQSKDEKELKSQFYWEHAVLFYYSLMGKYNKSKN